MSGIMTAVAGSSSNAILYTAGLYGPFGADALPITGSSTSAGGSTVTINRTWIGYLRPASTGTNTLSIQSLWDQYVIYLGVTYAFNWGGSPSSVSRIWVGATAESGYNTGNANATSSDSTATYSPSLTAGVNYPVRYQWTATLPYDAVAYAGAYPGYTTGSCSFSVSNGVAYYNSLTNGF